MLIYNAQSYSALINIAIDWVSVLKSFLLIDDSSSDYVEEKSLAAVQTDRQIIHDVIVNLKVFFKYKVLKSKNEKNEVLVKVKKKINAIQFTTDEHNLKHWILIVIWSTNANWLTDSANFVSL